MDARTMSRFVIPLLLLALGCGDDGGEQQVLSTIAGRVVAGPVSGATVTVRPLLDTGALGSALGVGTTDSEGDFSFEVAGYEGPAVVIATGGTYVDEATGNTIDADELEMASLVVLVAGEAHTAHVTAATSIAARRAMQLATSSEVDALAALENGVAMVEEYYAFTGILTTLPADLTAGPVAPGAAAEYGALNAGFSQAAANRGVHLWSLIAGLAEDGSDGTFDGHYFGGQISVRVGLGEGDLFWDDGGANLRDAITEFVGEAVNQSGLTIDDLALDEAIDAHVTPDGYSFCIRTPRIDNIEPALGLVGETADVTLYGEFPDLPSVDLTVTFGGVPATIVKGGDEELQVVAPASAVAGTVDVTIRCLNTHVHGTAQRAFEYYVADLLPVITGVKPDAGPPLGGTLLEITGRDFDPSATVEVGGVQAQVLARLGRTGLVAVAPAGTGTVSVTVRQGDLDATSAGAFSYVDEGAAGEAPSDADLEGQWRFYGLGHWYMGDEDTVVLLEASMAFAGGAFTETGNAWFMTPGNPEGDYAPLNASGPFRLLPDGMVWLEPSDASLAAHGFLTDERDVFIVANDTPTTGPMWLGAGIRRATGMSNASLAGTWHAALFSHAFALGPDERIVTSAWGTVEFDGAGRGSAGLTVAGVPSDLAAEPEREAIGTSLTYAVAADGTFTVTVPPDEVGGAPLVFRGSVTQAKDLAVAVVASEGQAQILMLVPAATGFGRPHVFGSWYGGGLAYEYEPFGRGNLFNGETIRMLHDGLGAGISEVLVRVTSDEIPDEGLETEIHSGVTICGTGGLLIGGPDDLSGFVGASRRFQIFLPANLEASPFAEPVEFMGASLLLRRPARYSSWTLDQAAYNAVGISTEYKTPGVPLSPDEENTSFRTALTFAAGAQVPEEETSDLVGGAREGAGVREEKTVNRWGSALTITVQSGIFPEFAGPYAVFGDGHLLMSVGPDEQPQLAASQGDMLEDLVGEITGNADLVLLRNTANPGASALVVLARAGEPVLDGIYNGGVLRFNYVEDGEWIEAGFGYMALDSGTSTLSGAGSVYIEEPGGARIYNDKIWQGSYFTVAGGLVAIDDAEMDLKGIATPDGTAVFLVDLEENLNTTLVVGLRQPPGPIASAGSYRFAGFAHEYLGFGAIPVEARKGVVSGSGRVTDVLDAGVIADERTNARGAVDRVATLFADNAIAVSPDGSVTWVRPDFDYRGWFAAGGRYAFLMPTRIVGEQVAPDAVALYIGVR